MVMEKIITIDVLKEGYPKFVFKETENTDNGFIMCEVDVAENTTYSGRVLSISTNGKYRVELLEEV